MTDAELMEVAGKLRVWREDPVQFVRECFGVEPDAWQTDTLRAFATSPRIAMKACKGPGKTCVIAWCAWNFLATRPHPKIAATSISADNLSDGLWTEMSKWQGKSPFLKATFTWTKTRIFANDHPETWWMSARSWSKSADSQQQADTLAGLHADFLLFILDEAGGIPDGVMAAAEAGLATGIECKILMAGNPTHLEGPLYRACTRERKLWAVIEITGDPDDPKRSPRISIQWAREQIEKYGADSPWVLVNVFGRFPAASLNALLGVDEVMAAMRRHYDPYDYERAAQVVGIDVARQGDDRTVIFHRQGLVAWPPIIMRTEKGEEIAGTVANRNQDTHFDAIFVDSTGGWGWASIEAMQRINLDPIGVEFSGKAMNPLYANKRTEIHFELAKWIKSGGALPDIPELVAELTTPTYSYNGDKMILEPKDMIKKRLGRSPDLADALALTFSYPVEAVHHYGHPALDAAAARNRNKVDYDPLEAS